MKIALKIWITNLETWNWSCPLKNKRRKQLEILFMTWLEDWRLFWVLIVVILHICHQKVLSLKRVNLYRYLSKPDLFTCCYFVFFFKEASRLKSKTHNMSDNLSSFELELRSCKSSLDAALLERENLQRQSGSQLLEIERLRQEKEALEMHQRVSEREISELRDKLSQSTRSLGSASGNIATQEATICQLRGRSKQGIIASPKSWFNLQMILSSKTINANVSRTNSVIFKSP